MPAESTAARLTDRLDALAAALRAAGVGPERSSDLLAAAATAMMHALTLDALAAPAASAPVPASDPVRLAA